jgi:hypothetical protein
MLNIYPEVTEIPFRSLKRRTPFDDGVGSFEEDLIEYVDRTTLLGDPLRLVRSLAEGPPPTHEELKSGNTDLLRLYAWQLTSVDTESVAFRGCLQFLHGHLRSWSLRRFLR